MFGGFRRFWRVWRVLEPFAGWQTAALKANRKPLLWPWPGALGACGLGPGVPVAEGVWRVLEGFGGCLESDGFGAFGEFWSVCGLANGSFESQ